MNNSKSYREALAPGKEAVIDSACKDEYTDEMGGIHFPSKKKKRDVTLKDIREWNKKHVYKESMGVTVNAMIDSAINDPYIDKNPPSKF